MTRLEHRLGEVVELPIGELDQDGATIAVRWPRTASISSIAGRAAAVEVTPGLSVGGSPEVS